LVSNGVAVSTLPPARSNGVYSSVWKGARHMPGSSTKNRTRLAVTGDRKTKMFWATVAPASGPGLERSARELSSRVVVLAVGVLVVVVAKLAVTATGVLPTSVVEVPAQPPPLQPVNVDPGSGAAASVTTVVLANAAAQVGSQRMPVGVLATSPRPAPFLLIVTLRVDPSVLVVAHASLEYGEAVVALYARRR
jgi:hypothetical protein